MDGEQNGTQASGEEQQRQQVEQTVGDEQPQHQAQEVTSGSDGDGAESSDANKAEAEYRAALADRDKKIAALEAQIVEASRTADAAEKLSAQIDELKAQAAVERDEHALAAAGCRSVRAGRAMLSEHGGDVAALKAAEPWLFGPKHARQEGATGLPSAGAAVSEDATLKRWRQIAGLDD